MALAKHFFAGALAIALVHTTTVTTWADARQHSEWAWDNVARVVVVPDIHGAYPALVRLLQSTGVIDDTLSWTGRDTHLVSLGDLLDRGPRSRDVMDLLMRLQTEARAAGGRVHVVAGNHELMNLIGDLRYVAKEEFAAFANDETPTMREQAYRDFMTDINETFASEEASRQRFDERYPAGFYAHRQAFAANGRYGQWLLALPAVITINDVAYAHGGLPPMMAVTSLDELNKEYRDSVRRYLRLWRNLVDVGALPNDQVQDAGTLARSLIQNAELSGCVQERMESCEQLQEQDTGEFATLQPEVFASLEEFIELSNAAVLSDDGPLWYRGGVLCRAIFERSILNASLANLGVQRLVVGHTTSPNARVHSLHDGLLTALDTGMLVSYYSGRPAALVTAGNADVVHYLDPEEQRAPDRDQYPHAYGLTRADLEELLSSGSIETVHRANGSAASRVQISHQGKTVPALHFAAGRGGRQELAAYALDKLLGFELVPATIARDVNGKTGALQLNYTDALSEAQRSQQGLGIGGWCPMGRQLQLMYAFDLLIANTGRSVDNLNFRQRTWTLYLSDHSSTFGNNKKLPRGLKSGAIVVTPAMRDALLQLNEDDLQAELGPWLSRKAIRALISRRNAMLKLLTD